MVALLSRDNETVSNSQTQQIRKPLCVSLKKGSTTTEKNLCENEKIGKFERLFNKKKRVEYWRNNINKFEKDLIMATFKELGEKYGKHLKSTRLISYLSIIEVEEKINNLTYSSTNNNLTQNDKIKILEYVEKEIKDTESTLLVESESVDSLIKLIEELKNKIKNG